MKRTTWTVLFATLALTAVGCGDEGDTYNTYNYAAPTASSDQPTPDAQVGNEAGTDAKPTDDAQVNNDAQPDSLQGDAGNDADVQGDAQAEAADAEAGQDAQTEAESDADAETVGDAGNDADAQPAHTSILTVTYTGPIPDKEAAGQVSNDLYRYTFCTTKLVEITEHGFLLDPLSATGRTQGTNNTKYFTDFTEKYLGGTLAGPKQLTTLPGDTMPRAVTFQEPHQIAAGTCETYTIKAQLAGSQDTMGEYLEQQFAMRLYSIGAQVLAGGDEPQTRWLYPDEFKYVGTLQGDAFTVKPCNPGVKVSCNCAGQTGWTYCGMDYEPMQSCVCPQQGLSAKLASYQPPTQIVVGGSPNYVVMSRYEATNITGGVRTLDRATGHQSSADATWKDFDQVALAKDGQVVALCSFDPNGYAAVCDQWVNSSVTIQPGETITLEVWAKMATIAMSTDTDNGPDKARSGHTPAFKLDSIWAEGNDFYTVIEAGEPNVMVLRASYPMFTWQNVANTVLVSGEMELYRELWQGVGAISTSVKQRAYVVDFGDQTHVTAGNYRYYRGSFQMDPSTYTVTDWLTGADLKTTALGQYHIAVVTFATEESFGNSGNVYSLRATVSKSGNGGNVVLASPYVYNPNYPVIVTGKLVNNDAYAPYPALTNVFNIAKQGGHTLGDTIWSDNMYLPHTFTANGSSDWTNIAYTFDSSKANTFAD